MLVFQEARVSIILIVEEDALQNDCRAARPPFCDRFVSEIRSDVRKLSAVIGEQFVSLTSMSSGSSSDPTYVYCNQTNSALKVLGLGKRKTKRGAPQEPPSLAVLSAALPRPSMQILDMMHAILEGGLDSGTFCGTPAARECFVKTQSRGWSVGRRSGARELFVLLDDTHDSLIDADTAMLELRENDFFNIMLE
jgi:hypothetical protein